MIKRQLFIIIPILVTIMLCVLTFNVQEWYFLVFGTLVWPSFGMVVAFIVNAYDEETTRKEVGDTYYEAHIKNQPIDMI